MKWHGQHDITLNLIALWHWALHFTQEFLDSFEIALSPEQI